MSVELRLVQPSPAGFGSCTSCDHRADGTPALCFACATHGADLPAGPRCAVCGQPLDGQDRCANAVCSYDDRWFSRIYTVSERTEEMWDEIYRYKYDEERERAEILGRILVGFLERHRAEMIRFDLITTGAIYVGPLAVRLWDYLRLVLLAAAETGPGWPFLPNVVAKAGPTQRFLGIDTEARREVAEGELRALLSVPSRELVAGKRVLVFDDVYSEGFSVREMARALRLAGATEVAGLVFTRRKGC